MDLSTQDKRLAGNQIVAAASSERRAFLKAVGGGVLGATAVAAGIRGAEAKSAFEPLWDSGQVLIGNSPTEQTPSSVITCPLFFDNGRFANASHGLDLTSPQVRGTVTVDGDTVEPNFFPNLAVSVTVGFDGVTYLLVAGEGTITGGLGYFRRINTAIIRCKYKVPAGTSPQSPPVLLIKCVFCMVILARKPV